MTESSETATVLAPVAAAEDAHRNSRLYRGLAWVGIVAGVLFIVGVVFFSGFFAARATGGDGWHRGSQGGQTQPGAPMGGCCPMMKKQPGEMGQGGMGPGEMPGGMGPGGMPGMEPGVGKSSTPASTTPVPPVAGQR